METTWLELFQQTFETDAPANEVIVEQNVAAALGEYQRTQVFVDTPWKAYVQGDANAISEAAKRGAALFFKPTEQGGANCVACHSGDFFTDEQFHVVAVPQVGPGKEDREADDEEEEDPFVRDDRGR